MNFSDYIAILALVISLVSIAISWYFGFRDRARLKSKCYLLYYGENEIPHLKVEIINAGRRPTYIMKSGGETDNGSWSSSFLGEKGKGIRLGEHEKYEEEKGINEIIFFNREGEEVRYINYWFEDSLGQRHIVKDSEKVLKSFQ